MGAGIPRGRFIEAVGDPATTKSAFGVVCAAAFQRAGGIAIYLDTEGKLEKSWAEGLGLDFDTLGYDKPKDIVDAVKLIGQVAKTANVKVPTIIIWDSLSPDARILTNRGEMKIKDIVADPDLMVYTMLPDGHLGMRRVKAAAQTGWSKRVVRVRFRAIRYAKRIHDSIVCTPDHELWTSNRGWIKAEDLVEGDRLVPVHRSITTEKKNEKRIRVSSALLEKWRYEHHLVMESVMSCAMPRGSVVHHVNHDPTDNRVSNLRWEPNQSAHIKSHCAEDPAWRERAVRLGKSWKGKERVAQLHANERRRLPMMEKAKEAILAGFTRDEAARDAGVGRTTLFRWLKSYPDFFERNHKVILVEDAGTADTFDLCVEGSDNFVANGIVVHNSIAATPGAQELEDATSEEGMPAEKAARARYLSGALRATMMELSRRGVTLVGINQLRVTMNFWSGSSGKDSPGGRAIKYHAGLRLMFRNRGRMEDRSRGVITGIAVEVEAIKNTCSRPFRKAQMKFRFTEGFDTTSGLVELLVRHGRITSAAGWCRFKDKKFRPDEIESIASEMPELLAPIDDSAPVEPEPEPVTPDDTPEAPTSPPNESASTTPSTVSDDGPDSGKTKQDKPSTDAAADATGGKDGK